MAKKLTVNQYEIKYDSHGRLMYHPEYHHNQDKPYTVGELAYLCYFYEIDSIKYLSLALGRMEYSISEKVKVLKKENSFEHYKSVWNKIFQRELQK